MKTNPIILASDIAYLLYREDVPGEIVDKIRQVVLDELTELSKMNFVSYVVGDIK